PPATAVTAAPMPAARAHPANDPAVRSLAEEAGNTSDSYYDNTESPSAEQPELAAAAAVPAGPPIVRPVDPPAVAPLNPRRASETRNGADADEVLPTATGLSAAGTSLPEMRLDIHVYSNTPAERFVFINMRKYTEGQTLSEGPTLERITPDGAILNQQGLRFLLPRQ
ncbi:MAG TPA: general secretion pathway protein GspB, partial [Povalibacter sp.]|nr:general secretion pathway protein GspB [Povalibacter sp.]